METPVFIFFDSVYNLKEIRIYLARKLSSFPSSFCCLRVQSSVTVVSIHVLPDLRNTWADNPKISWNRFSISVTFIVSFKRITPVVFFFLHCLSVMLGSKRSFLEEPLKGL